MRLSCLSMVSEKSHALRHTYSVEDKIAFCRQLMSSISDSGFTKNDLRRLKFDYVKLDVLAIS